MELIRQVLAVGGVLLLLAGSLWWLRRRGLARYGLRARSQRHLEAVERLPLGPQHALYVVRFSGRGLLLAISPAGCAVLESFPWPIVDTALAAPTEVR